MERKLRNRVLIFLLVAGIVAFVLVRISGRQPVAKISAMTPKRQNIVSSISSNGKVEPISPYSIRAQLDTFVDQVHVSEGQNVKKGQLLVELNVKDAAAQLALAKSKLLRAEDDLRAAKAGGRADEASRVNGDLVEGASRPRSLAEKSRLAAAIAGGGRGHKRRIGCQRTGA